MAFLVGGGTLVAAADFYVAPSGNDTNPGTAQYPLRSLAAARDRARPVAGREPVTVRIADGWYPLRHPIVFGPEDSGAVGAPVMYAALPGTRPILSGGQRLSLAWIPHRGGIWRASVPPGVSRVDQLFVNSERRPCARWPNWSPDSRGIDRGYATGLRPLPGAPVSRVVPPLAGYPALVFEEWKQSGLDQHSQFADPQFINPDQGHYRVPERSPAWQLGFRNFPMDQFGARKPEWQPILKKCRLLKGKRMGWQANEGRQRNHGSPMGVIESRGHEVTVWQANGVASEWGRQRN